jgi:hypothetical protein
MTPAPSDGWTVMQSRVSLAGRVTGGDGDIATGGVLSLAAAAGAARGKAASPPPPPMPRRYEARIRPDGFYFFLDLPAGDYLLDGQDQRGNKITAQRVSIPAGGDPTPPDIVSVDLAAATPAQTSKPAADRPAPAGQADAGSVVKADHRSAARARRRTKQ